MQPHSAEYMEKMQTVICTFSIAYRIDTVVRSIGVVLTNDLVLDYFVRSLGFLSLQRRGLIHEFKVAADVFGSIFVATRLTKVLSAVPGLEEAGLLPVKEGIVDEVRHVIKRHLFFPEDN